jgi:thioredoxin-dependent peroxiredoxin
VAIVGASADPEKALASFREKQKLNFTLVGDPTRRMIEAYGVWRPKKFMGRIFKGIVRSTFLIGTDGKIEEIWDEVKVKGHVSEVLKRVSSITV